MKILISAAETSSDQHGAQLLQALKRQAPVEAIGIGGPRLREAGLRVLVDARELLAMGFGQVLVRLPQIFRALNTVTAAAEAERPDVAVVIDYPDFHFRLAKRLKRLGVPVVYYIPPKVWVWRKGRVRILRERFERILSILPFEVEFYRRERIPVTYVGNPLIDELPLDLTRDQARAMLGLSESERVLVLMPGSRPSELKHHLDLMLNAALGAAREMRTKLTVLVPFPATADFPQMQVRIGEWARRHPGCEELLILRASRANAPECLVAADAGLIKSGTSTLEAGVLGCIHSIVYQSDWFSHFVFHRIVRLTFKGPVGLVNLVYGWKAGEPWLIREFIDYKTETAVFSKEIVSLFEDQARREKIRAGLSALRKKVIGENGEQKSPSEAAAREILKLVAERRGARK